MYKPLRAAWGERGDWEWEEPPSRSSAKSVLTVSNAKNSGLLLYVELGGRPTTR